MKVKICQNCKSHNMLYMKVCYNCGAKLSNNRSIAK